MDFIIGFNLGYLCCMGVVFIYLWRRNHKEPTE